MSNIFSLMTGDFECIKALISRNLTRTILFCLSPLRLPPKQHGQRSCFEKSGFFIFRFQVKTENAKFWKAPVSHKGPGNDPFHLILSPAFLTIHSASSAKLILVFSSHPAKLRIIFLLILKAGGLSSSACFAPLCQGVPYNQFIAYAAVVFWVQFQYLTVYMKADFLTQRVILF